MAAVGSQYPTLIDVASATDASGKIASIVEILNAQNEILPMIPFVECNDGSGHKTTVRSGLPAPTWRQLNYGVQPTKATVVPVRDACGMLEDYAEIDKALADLNGNSAAYRLQEDKAHIEGMNQSFMSTLIYGNTATNPERFMGLAPRYSVKTGTDIGDNILLGGGAGADNTSIWLAVLGPETLTGLFPKGSKAGLTHTDKGQVTIENAGGVAGYRMEAYRSHYKWDAGLCLRDWRYVVRIANVSVGALTKNAATGADLIDLMVQALEQVPNLNAGKPVFICNRTVRSFLRRQITNKTNAHLSLDEVAGKKVVMFDEVPVLRTDAILNTEAVVA